MLSVIMITLHKLPFTSDLLARITQAIQDDPKISRRQLSVRICEWMDWRRPNGKPRDMACRKALLILHRRKEIVLPDCDELLFQARQVQPLNLPAPFPVSMPLDELGPVELIPIHSASSHNARVWRTLFDAHHYLGSGPLCGAQLRYLVWSERFGWLGGLSFSAAAWRVRCRDEYIGWSEEARQHTLQQVVNNSRFLILPTVNVPGLASHILAQCCKRLANDWHERYAYRPVLLETFVDLSRFSGTCYQAANWQHVGATTGRGRQDTGTTKKKVFLYPLCKDWQQTLCSLPDGTVSTRSIPRKTEPAHWMEEEFGGAKLGDKRLVDRLMQLGESFFARPTANIPEACMNTAATKAAYRFFDNNDVTMEAILAPHFQATEARLHHHKLVLVAQDTSSLNYTHHGATTGLGPINTTKDQGVGLLLHDTMAFTPEGTPLGLLDVQLWARDAANAGQSKQRKTKSIEDKESFKWLKSYRSVCAVQARCPNTRLVVVADREADIYELFADSVQIRKSAELLIRAEKTRSRSIVDDQDEIQKLWPYMESLEASGIIELTVPPRHDRPTRMASLEIRFTGLTLKAPHKKKLPDIPVHVVYAKEINPPVTVDEPLEWMLISSMPVTTFEQAQTALSHYARRWGIEVYHRVLKSGCRIEDRQLGTATRLENCLAIDMVVAWRIQHLTWLGRETPDLPCTVFFEHTEWQALVGFIKQTPQIPSEPPTLHAAMIMVATLGGFLGRKSDGNPGTETLWRGLQRLDDITRAYIAFVVQPQTTTPVSSPPTYG
jgi:hypothetical protein